MQQCEIRIINIVNSGIKILKYYINLSQPQSMQYLAAYTLATLSGKEPTEETITAILNSTGKPVDAAQVKAVVANLKGKQVHELITKGQAKVGSVGGGAAGGAAAKGGKDEKKDDKKKEEKKPEPKKEEKKPEPEPEQENFNLDLFG